MKKQSTESESTIPILPDHLILEHILTRLPVKSLIRFKSVSKHWFFTISSHEFNKNRLKFFSNCNQGFILWKVWIHDNSNSNFLSFDECLNVKEFVELESKYPSLNLLPKYSRVVGSCNGLVCLYDTSKGFYLWNPATNQCRNANCPNDILSFPPTRLMLRGESRICNVFMGYGFGYVPSIDDYRIAGSWACTKGLCHVYVFSLRARTWKKMASFDEIFYIRVGNIVGRVIEDTMYWPPVIHTNHENHMVMLDLAGGKLKKIPLMDFGVSYEYCGEVFQMKGCLSLCCMNYINNNSRFRVYDVWMLKQLDDWNSWEKVSSFEDRQKGWPLHFFETGECLVRRDRDQLILHCPSQAAPEQYGEGSLIWQGYEKEQFFPRFDRAWGYVESLISPFGTPEMMPTLEDDAHTRE